MFYKPPHKNTIYWAIAITLLAMLTVLSTLLPFNDPDADRKYHEEAQYFCEDVGKKSREFDTTNGNFPTNLRDIGLSDQDVPYLVAYPFEGSFNGLEGGPYCVYKGENMRIGQFVFYDLKKDSSVDIDMGG